METEKWPKPTDSLLKLMRKQCANFNSHTFSFFMNSFDYFNLKKQNERKKNIQRNRIYIYIYIYTFVEDETL